VIDGKVIVAGGEGNPGLPSGVFPEVELYDPDADLWLSEQPMLTPRHGMAGAVWERSFYVPGGALSAGFAAVTTHEVFTLAEAP
jgi:hypothetical protein